MGEYGIIAEKGILRLEGLNVPVVTQESGQIDR